MLGEKQRETVLKVSLAGLFHDVGKFAQGCLDIPEEYRQKNSDLYQPFNQRHGYYTHAHALYTAAFIEACAEDGVLPAELSSREWGEGETTDSFVNLAAKHHKPETPLQWIIAQADRLSSGIDRAEFEKGESIGVREVTQTRLLPIFERLLREDKSFDRLEDFLWRYPLKPISAINIFPERVLDAGVSREEAWKDYRSLFGDFREDLKRLCNRQKVELWAQHFDSLYRIYVSHIPAARVGMVVHDVSLYDHSRATAALAGALYLYHCLSGSMTEEAIKDDSQATFLLVSGDFYGIQDFIFRGGGEERHHRAKLLRGRSFLVSLMMEVAADFVCREVGLSFLSVVLSAAGKFHLIAPNLGEAKDAITWAKEKLNRWLYEHFYGECSIGFSWTEAKAEDFYGKKFQELWRRHLEGLEEAKYQRFDLGSYGGAVAEVRGKGYLEDFRNDLDSRLCPLCGRRPSHPDVTGDEFIKKEGESSCACKLCRDQAFIGTKLVKGDRMAVLLGEEGGLKEPIFGEYQIKFVGGCAGQLVDTCKVIRLFDFNVRGDGSCSTEVTFLPINGYVPVYTKKDERKAGEKSEQKKEEPTDDIKEGKPKTFHHLAQKALRIDGEGLPVLGVLKADVDNLGAIFGCGLPPKLFTLSRLATMSRQLNNFFAIYLPYALEKEENGRFKEIYTVFAGGDDLFLIGPWNAIKEFALFVRDKFVRYVCENPEIHLSAGITLHKAYTPVDLLTRESEGALEQAKGVQEKNAVTMFGYPVGWDKFKDLLDVQRQVEDWYKKGYLSRGALYRFNELCFLASEEEELLKSGTIPCNRLQCVKWGALLRYFLVRSIPKEMGNDWERVYQDVASNVYKWLADYRGRFVIALWPLIYETRRQRI